MVHVYCTTVVNKAMRMLVRLRYNQTKDINESTGILGLFILNLIGVFEKNH